VWSAAENESRLHLQHTWPRKSRLARWVGAECRSVGWKTGSERMGSHVHRGTLTVDPVPGLSTPALCTRKAQ
jgi:hypothetical protein